MSNKFYLLVAGSRTFNDYSLLKEKLDYLLKKHTGNVVIIEGEAAGADTLARKYAEENGYECMKFPVAWDFYGKRAGYIRNRKMHEELSKHEMRGCVLFWDMKSKGTKHNIELCEEFKTPLRIVDYNNRLIIKDKIEPEEEIER